MSIKVTVQGFTAHRKGHAARRFDFLAHEHSTSFVLSFPSHKLVHSSPIYRRPRWRTRSTTGRSNLPKSSDRATQTPFLQPAKQHSYSNRWRHPCKSKVQQPRQQHTSLHWPPFYNSSSLRPKKTSSPLDSTYWPLQLLMSLPPSYEQKQTISWPSSPQLCHRCWPMEKRRQRSNPSSAPYSLSTKLLPINQSD